MTRDSSVLILVRPTKYPLKIPFPIRVCRIVLALLVPLTILRSQEVKLKVRSVDSVLSVFSDRGFLKGTIYVEGTLVPLKGASLTLSEEPVDSSNVASGFIARGHTDNAGTFGFNLVPEGQYYLESAFPGYFPHTESVWIGSQELTDIEVEMVPDYSHPSLHRTGSIEFEISDRSTGEAVTAATIDLKDLRVLVNTGQSGVRYIHLLKPKTYHFRVSADGYQESVEDSIGVVAGTCRSVRIRLRELGTSLDDLLCREDHRKPYPVSMVDPSSFCSLTGELVDSEDGRLILFEPVYLAPYGLVAETDSTGLFTFQGLRPGVYCATARVPGYARATRHGIELTAGKTTRVHLSLRRTDGARTD